MNCGCLPKAMAHGWGGGWVEERQWQWCSVHGRNYPALFCSFIGIKRQKEQPVIHYLSSKWGFKEKPTYKKSMYFSFLCLFCCLAHLHRQHGVFEEKKYIYPAAIIEFGKRKRFQQSKKSQIWPSESKSRGWCLTIIQGIIYHDLCTNTNRI